MTESKQAITLQNKKPVELAMIGDRRFFAALYQAGVSEDFLMHLNARSNHRRKDLLDLVAGCLEPVANGVKHKPIYQKT